MWPRRIASDRLLNLADLYRLDHVLADRKIVAGTRHKIVATIAEFRATSRIRSRIVRAAKFDRLVSLISATDGKVVMPWRFRTARPCGSNRR